MTFKQMYFDSQILGGQETLNFFTESEEDNESVTTMTEDQAIKWIFNVMNFGKFFCDEFFFTENPIYAFHGLTEPFTTVSHKPGDIDLLLVDPERPDLSIAFECKRVKITSQVGSIPKINNAKGLRKGVVQANKYQSLGFHQSYLLVILLDDGRHQKYENTVLRNTKCNTVEEIYDIPWNENIHDDVGIIYLKVTQQTGKSYNLMAGIGFCIDKEAGKLEQSTSMTNKIKHLLKCQQ